MNPIGDADQVEDLARLYRREAQQVERTFNDSMRQLQRTIDSDAWAGRRASRVLHDVMGDRRVVATQVTELRSMARELDRHALWIRETIRELEGIEQSVRGWAAAHPPNPQVPGPDSSLITSWPAPWSYEWRALRRRLRSAGATV
jgi:hypothetical protein